MPYQTSHLVAVEPFRHAGRWLEPGDDFEATEIDARYYKGNRTAKDFVADTAPVSAMPTTDLSQSAAPAQRPLAAIDLDVGASADADTGAPPGGEQDHEFGAPDEIAPAVADGDAQATDLAPPARRRGRPSKADLAARAEAAARSEASAS